ncbi:MAG: FtsQ-type POTRA domain-containing protein [Candidatus Schmidhempelia sp.]|nr:FtsQ-type POTRA domain-containing protein [Candidatus Schmidhempelia sp.]
MKKIRQAELKKNLTKKRSWLFHSREQFIGFLFFLLIISVSFWIVNTLLHWMNNPEQAVLSQLAVTGDRQYTTNDDIREAVLALGLPDTFVGQDVDAIRQEVLRIPWIKQVSVRKQWPDKLNINVVEYRPMAYWNDAFLLDQQGVLFSLPQNRIVDKTLPSLYGPENTESNVLAMYQHLKEVLYQQFLMGHTLLIINSINVNERYSWSLKLKPCKKMAKYQVVNHLVCESDQYIKVILGREDLENRLERFILLYPKIKEQTASDEIIDVVDLRYNNGASVQRNKL